MDPQRHISGQRAAQITQALPLHGQVTFDIALHSAERIGNSAATPRRDSSRAPSAARQPRRCALESGGAQWSAAWTCSAGWERGGPSEVPGKGGCGGHHPELAVILFILSRYPEEHDIDPT